MNEELTLDDTLSTWSSLISAEEDWTGARCINRPDEFCPREDIMTDENWTKKVALESAKECITCPAFKQCKKSLLEQLDDDDLKPTGIMAGVILVQKSDKQIRNALEKVERRRQPHP